MTKWTIYQVDSGGEEWYWGGIYSKKEDAEDKAKDLNDARCDDDTYVYIVKEVK